MGASRKTDDIKINEKQVKLCYTLKALRNLSWDAKLNTF